MTKGYYGSSGYSPLAVSQKYAGVRTINLRAASAKDTHWGSRSALEPFLL